MINKAQMQEVDLWEAWIDFQSTTGLATLYVIGNVFTNYDFIQPYFIKKNTGDTEVLALEILPQICSENGFETEIMYAEEIYRIDQYKSIAIYSGEELITSITDIESFC